MVNMTLIPLVTAALKLPDGYLFKFVVHPGLQEGLDEFANPGSYIGRNALGKEYHIDFLIPVHAGTEDYPFSFEELCLQPDLYISKKTVFDYFGIFRKGTGKTRRTDILDNSVYESPVYGKIDSRVRLFVRQCPDVFTAALGIHTVEDTHQLLVHSENIRFHYRIATLDS